MFIAVNTINVPSQARGHMVDAFKRNAPSLREMKGFAGFEIWTEEDGKLLAVSKWDTKEDFDAYISSDMFRAHHGGAGSSQMGGQAQVTYYNGETLL